MVCQPEADNLADSKVFWGLHKQNYSAMLIVSKEVHHSLVKNDFAKSRVLNYRHPRQRSYNPPRTPLVASKASGSEILAVGIVRL